ncbi:unnamed protein product, partial [Sphacelaria rigidula]
AGCEHVRWRREQLGDRDKKTEEYIPITHSNHDGARYGSLDTYGTGGGDGRYNVSGLRRSSRRGRNRRHQGSGTRSHLRGARDVGDKNNRHSNHGRRANSGGSGGSGGSRNKRSCSEVCKTSERSSSSVSSRRNHR